MEGVFQKLVEKGKFQNQRQVSLISRYLPLFLDLSRRLSTVFECLEVLAVCLGASYLPYIEI